ncbi:MAG: ferrochelatase, partial [Myxococcales bacterium]|nr:ferrochelatase [Myxococcales bacterium]
MPAPTAVDKPGALLINLGTPEAPEPGPVRRYLREFLSDPRVIDINPISRWLLLNLVILPFRPARSAAAYRKVWTPEGSPLLVHGRALTAEVQRRLPDWEVRLAMRYGQPSLRDGLAALREAGCDRVVALPLYPQYAASSTGSTIEALYRIAGEMWNTPFITLVPPFYEHPGFIEALAERGRAVLEELRPDHVLFSFHGLPLRHLTKGDPAGHCKADAGCCARISAVNQNCYRAQSHATARALAAALGVAEDGYTVSFQSRLGRTEWIKPYTDE